MWCGWNLPRNLQSTTLGPRTATSEMPRMDSGAKLESDLLVCPGDYTVAVHRSIHEPQHQRSNQPQREDKVRSFRPTKHSLCSFCCRGEWRGNQVTIPACSRSMAPSTYMALLWEIDRHGKRGCAAKNSIHGCLLFTLHFNLRVIVVVAVVLHWSSEQWPTAILGLPSSLSSDTQMCWWGVEFVQRAMIVPDDMLQTCNESTMMFKRWYNFKRSIDLYIRRISGFACELPPRKADMLWLIIYSKPYYWKLWIRRGRSESDDAATFQGGP